VLNRLGMAVPMGKKKKTLSHYPRFAFLLKVNIVRTGRFVTRNLSVTFELAFLNWWPASQDLLKKPGCAVSRLWLTPVKRDSSTLETKTRWQYLWNCLHWGFEL